LLAFGITAFLLSVAAAIVLPDSDKEGDGGRWPRRLVLASAAAGLALLIVGLFWLVVAGIQCNDGDGGSPYTARDSLYADYCGTGAYWIALGLPVVPLLMGATISARRARWRPFGIGLAVGALLACSPMLASAALPGTCSDEAERKARAAGEFQKRCEHY
jgi:hypothetical protein